MRISVIIPTLNESGTIAGCLANLAGQGADEVIVADADSPDGTAKLAEGAGARVVRSPRGRGVQQNRGAEAASGDVLLFLHADCRLQDSAIAYLKQYAGACPKVPGGCFRMRVDAPDWLYRPIDAAAHLRAGLLGLPYGDQGIWVQRWAFKRVGGFPELSLMEDVCLGSRLRRLGRLVVLPRRIEVSPRRWRQQGIIRQSVRNWALTVAAGAGVGMDVLARFYPVVR